MSFRNTARPSGRRTSSPTESLLREYWTQDSEMASPGTLPSRSGRVVRVGSAYRWFERRAFDVDHSRPELAEIGGRPRTRHEPRGFEDPDPLERTERRNQRSATR